MSDYISIEQWNALPASERRLKHERPAKRSKFNNQPVEFGGYTFDSLAECEYFKKLLALERAGQIAGLRVHPVYQLQPAFIDATGKKHQKITYEADFAFIEDGQDVAVDIKGMRTDVFRLKEKMFRYCYPAIEFRVIDTKRATGSKRRGKR